MEPRLTKRKDIYQVEWYDSERRKVRRQSLRTRDPAQAQRRFGIWLTQDEAERQGGVTVTTVLDQYDQHHVERHVVDKERVRYALRWLQKYFDGAVTNITPDDIYGYITARQAGNVGKPAGYGTIRRELGALVAAINYAVKTRVLPRDQAPYIPLPDKPPAKDRVLTDDEEAILLAGAQTERCKMFIRIALETGARRSHIERLTWDRVDFDNRMIDFHDPHRPRTKKRAPKVPMSDYLFDHLRGWREKNPDEPYTLPGGGSIKRSFNTAATRAGLSDVTPHTLRHTWATKAARAGVSLWDIAGVLGNSYALVAQTYAHHSPDYLRDAVNFRR